MDYFGIFLQFWVLACGLVLVIFASKIGGAIHNIRVEQAKTLSEERKDRIARSIYLGGANPREFLKTSPKVYIWLCRSMGIFFLIISGLTLIAIFS
jgi:hypothetical protein